MADTGTYASTDHVPIAGLLTRRGAVKARAQVPNKVKMFLLDAAAVMTGSPELVSEDQDPGHQPRLRMLAARPGACVAALASSSVSPRCVNSLPMSGMNRPGVCGVRVSVACPHEHLHGGPLGAGVGATSIPPTSNMCTPSWVRRRGKSSRYTEPVTLADALGREEPAARPTMVAQHAACPARDVSLALASLAHRQCRSTAGITDNALTGRSGTPRRGTRCAEMSPALPTRQRSRSARPSKAMTLAQAKKLMSVVSNLNEHNLGAYVMLCLQTGIRTRKRPPALEAIDLDVRPDENPPVPPSIAVCLSARGARRHQDAGRRGEL
jgi:hypothetical protein